MVPIPKGPRGDRGTELNSMMMGLFSGIKEPAVRDAAWEYMRFFDSREATAIKTRVMVESGLGRFIHPRYLRLFGYPEIERLSPPGWARTFDVAMETGKPEPYGGNSNLAYEMMTLPLQKAETLALKDQLPDEQGRRLDILQDLLRDGVRRANEQMMGVVSPRDRLIRRSVAGVVLAGILGAFILGFRKITRLFTPPGEVPAEGVRVGGRCRVMWVALLLLPAILTVFLWHYVPLLRGSLMAFQDYRLLGASTWVGLDNFGDVLFDGAWWQAVVNSFRYSFLVLALTFLPPIALAVLLQEIPVGKLFFRLVFYLPAVVTGIVTILLWKEFFDPSEHGVLNAVVLKIPAIGFLLTGVVLLTVSLLFARRLRMNDRRWAAWGFAGAGVLLLITMGQMAWPILCPGGEPLGVLLTHLPVRLFRHVPEAYHWLADPDTAMLSCVIPMVWAGMGPGCLIYLAALKGIPDDYYEAADVDGATFIDKILFVVFPVLKPLILINFVGAFIGSFYAATGNILVMTGGAANTEVAGLHIWYKAFTFLKFGPATAAAWMLGVILIGFTVQQLKMLSRVEFRANGQ
jgi:multiple sugar transport system permease protein